MAKVPFDVRHLRRTPTIGAYAHNRFHELQKDLEGESLPDIGSTWIMRIHHMEQRPDLYTPVEKAIDRNWARSDQFKLILAGIEVLADELPRLYKAITLCCVEDALFGSIRPIGREDWRHGGDGWKGAVNYFGSSGAARDNLRKGWEYVAVLVIGPDALAEAKRVSGATLKEAVAWAEQRGGRVA